MQISNRTLSATSGVSQAGVSLCLIFRSIGLEGPIAIRACILGLVLVISLVAQLVLRARHTEAPRDRTVENAIIDLRQTQRDQQLRIDALRVDVDREVIDTNVQAIAGAARKRGVRHLTVAPEE